VAEALVRRRRVAAPHLEVDHLPLWTEELPPFDGPALAAKYARLAGRGLDPLQAEAWSAIEGLVRRLDAADEVLLSTPMWNLSVPYRLKHYIDLITQPGLTFRFEPEAGYTPLLRDRPVTIVVASSGDFATGQSYGRPDLLTPYLRAALAFVGLRSVLFISVAPTAGPPEAVDAAVARSLAQLAEPVA
jgi:FMN-dependent NADH-azoreductase